MPDIQRISGTMASGPSGIAGGAAALRSGAGSHQRCGPSLRFARGIFRRVHAAAENDLEIQGKLRNHFPWEEPRAAALRRGAKPALPFWGWAGFTRCSVWGIFPAVRAAGRSDEYASAKAKRYEASHGRVKGGEPECRRLPRRRAAHTSRPPAQMLLWYFRGICKSCFDILYGRSFRQRLHRDGQIPSADITQPALSRER